MSDDKKIKVALLGFGKTGKIVAQNLSEDPQFKLMFVISNNGVEDNKFNFLVRSKAHISELFEALKPDVVIDFTTPDAVLENIYKLPRATAYVIATTGFDGEQINTIRKYDHLKIAYGANISDGINVVIKVCKLLNEILDDVDVEIIEQHFKGKERSPTKTAKKIASTFTDKAPHIHSVRAGGIVGIHEVILATNDQKITLKHESFHRGVFAEGVKKAALWLLDKPCGFYEIDEVYRQPHES